MLDCRYIVFAILIPDACSSELNWYVGWPTRGTKGKLCLAPPAIAGSQCLFPGKWWATGFSAVRLGGEVACSARRRSADHEPSWEAESNVAVEEQVDVVQELKATKMELAELRTQMQRLIKLVDN